MEPSVRDVILYPNWIWVAGALILFVAVLWLVGLLIGYRVSRVSPETQLRGLAATRRARYYRLIKQIEDQYDNGIISAREAHLSMAALIRAAATERTRVNVEAFTVQETKLYQSEWPELGLALEWCEEPSFRAGEANRHIHDGAELARGVIG